MSGARGATPCLARPDGAAPRRRREGGAGADDAAGAAERLRGEGEGGGVRGAFWFSLGGGRVLKRYGARLCQALGQDAFFPS